MGFYQFLNCNVYDTLASWGRGGSSWFSNSFAGLFGGNSFSSWGRYFSPSFSGFSNRYTSIFPSYTFSRYSMPSSTRSWSWNSSLTRLGTPSRSTSNFSWNSRGLASTSTARFGTQSYSPAVATVQTAARASAPVAVSANFRQRLKDLGPEFLNKVKQVAKNINCDYKDLLAVMNAESGLNHTIQNQAGHHYYGLIQFGEDAARSVGTTTAKLVKMSAVEQLDYVEKYFLNQRSSRGWGNKKLTAADLYALVFAPARAKGQVLYTKAANTKAYNANRTIDIKFGNSDGVISKNELQCYMNSKRVDENLFLA